MTHPQITLQDVQDALHFIADLAHVREDWITVGMAIKAEFGNAGFDAWDAWSSSYPKYRQAEALGVWRSFRRGGVGIGTLLKIAMEAGWQPKKTEWTDAEKAQFARERAARMAVVERQAEEDAAHIAAWERAVGDAARAVWTLLKPVGPSEYLGRKKVGAFGVGFPPFGILLVYRGDYHIDVVTGAAAIKAAFAEREEAKLPVRYIRPGDLVLPVMRDGALVNLQVINKAGKKLYLKHGPKSGGYCLLGPAPVAGQPVAVCEGYATGASIHMARGWPVFVVFDSGNMPVFAEFAKKHFAFCTFFWCADDDSSNAENSGVKKAGEAAAILPGAVVVPRFGGRPLV